MYRFVDEPKRKGGKPQHLHTFDGEPLFGTSTVLSVIAKGGLVWWASERAISHLGWTPIKDPQTKAEIPRELRLAQLEQRFSEILVMTDEEFLDCLDEARKAHMVKLEDAATAGTDMHAELENYVKWCIRMHNGEPQEMEETDHIPVQLFSKWSCENVKRFVHSEAYCYSKELWTGGIVDLIYLSKDDELVMLDFKSAKEAYDSHFMQNAGYDIAITENGVHTKDGELLEPLSGFKKYAVLPFGMLNPEPQFNTQPLRIYQEGFRSCVTLWRVLNGKY